MIPRPFRHHIYANRHRRPPGRVLPFGTVIKRPPAHPRHAQAPAGGVRLQERGGRCPVDVLQQALQALPAVHGVSERGEPTLEMKQDI